ARRKTKPRPRMTARILFVIGSRTPSLTGTGFSDLDGHDLHAGTGGAGGIARRDGHQYVEPFPDAAKNGVLSVQPGGRDGGDEELGAVRVRPRVGHAQHAGPVITQVLVELIGETVARSASPRSGGIAPLRHEVGNDPMEHRPVVEALTGQENEVVHRAGSSV